MDKKDQSSKDGNTFHPNTYDHPFPSVTMGSEAINNFISGMGIKFTHYKAMPDPLFKLSEGDVRDSFDQEDGYQFSDSKTFIRENGMLYIKQQTIVGIFMNNNKNLASMGGGMYVDSNGMISFNRYYENSTKVARIAEYDKFIMSDCPSELLTTNWQTFEHNPTGIDRMQFAVEDVEFIVDSAGVSYEKNIDFEISKKVIQWKSGPKAKRPGMDPLTNKGRVCSIRYQHIPILYVQQVMHDLRVRPDIIDGQVKAVASGVLCQVRRDYIFLDKRTANDADIESQLDALDTSNTGPR
ncbi:MAG TPA: hypothetical protein PKI14_04480 [Fervidobacterium sp.]|nr:hypothetical protein [Fervidobacterium sp.]